MVLTISSVSAFATPVPPLQQGPITASTLNSTIYTDDTVLSVGLPPGWGAVDTNNTSTEAKQIAASQLKETLVEFCPQVQSVRNSSDGIVTLHEHSGVIQVSRYVNMDKNPDFACGAASVDPSSSLIVMNLTAQDLVDFQDRSSPNMVIVQTKDVLVNVRSNGDNGGGAQWRILGKLVLGANQINQLGWIQLLFVDWTSGYEVSYIAPETRGKIKAVNFHLWHESR